jgi:hypothetical protein
MLQAVLQAMLQAEVYPPCPRGMEGGLLTLAVQNNTRKSTFCCNPGEVGWVERGAV